MDTIVEKPATRRYVRRSVMHASGKAAGAAASVVPPPGYMTGEEFERSVIEDLRKLYKEHGLL